MTANRYSAEGFTPRKTSFAIMNGRRYRLPSPPGIQARSMWMICSTASMKTDSGSGAMAMRSAEPLKRRALASERNRFTPPSSRL